jgi:hypothetical protein
MKIFSDELLKFSIIALIKLLLVLLRYFMLAPFKMGMPYQDYSFSLVIPNRNSNQLLEIEYINNYIKIKLPVSISCFLIQ